MVERKKKIISKSAVKKAVKPVTVKRAVRAAKAAPVSEEKAGKKNVQLTVLDVDGKAAGKITVSGELFDANINPKLMAQAVRVYLANQREGGAATKTRSQVRGSTRKIYRQKGTGRARHGAIRAPIFVGGGIAFGPVPHDFRLNLPHKMNKAALASALTTKRTAGDVIVVDGLAAVTPKTKEMAKTFGNIGATGSSLLVVGGDSKKVVRATRNISGVEIIPVANLNTFAVLGHGKLVFMKEAITQLSVKK
jgi:large subunit ribosomal protein L4